MNNKGFAITTVLYGTLILFCLLIISMLGILSTWRNNLDKLIDNSGGSRSIVTMEKKTVSSEAGINQTGLYCIGGGCKYYSYAATPRTVTFNTNGGGTINAVTVSGGGVVSKPSNPVKSGYTFVEWQLNNAAYDFNSPVTGNITLSAVYIKINDMGDGFKKGVKRELYSYYPTTATVKNLNIKLSNTALGTITEEVVGNKTLGYITPSKLGTSNISVNNSVIQNLQLKVIPNLNPINLSTAVLSTYVKNITFNNPRGTNEGFQEFDFVNINGSNPTYYFSLAYYGVLSNYQSSGDGSLPSNLDKQLNTSVICKTNKIVSNTQVSCSYMFVDGAGQGQTFIKEQTGDYFWTSYDTRSKTSGCTNCYNTTKKKYFCVNDKCTWWGGNNASLKRFKFATNSYGGAVTGGSTYTFGDRDARHVTYFIAADWDNNLILTIDYPVDKKNHVKVYDATKFINGTLANLNDVIYSFEANGTLGNDSSIQGYAISGGYMYVWRGNWQSGLKIQQFNMYGKELAILNVTDKTNFAKYREEGQGLVAYNNKLYFGSVHRSNASCTIGVNDCVAINPSLSGGIFYDAKYNIYTLSN